MSSLVPFISLVPLLMTHARLPIQATYSKVADIWIRQLNSARRGSDAPLDGAQVVSHTFFFVMARFGLTKLTARGPQEAEMEQHLMSISNNNLCTGVPAATAALGLAMLKSSAGDEDAAKVGGAKVGAEEGGWRKQPKTHTASPGLVCCSQGRAASSIEGIMQSNVYEVYEVSILISSICMLILQQLYYSTRVADAGTTQ